MIHTKLDDIYDNQHELMGVNPEMYYEQKRQGRHLNFLEKAILEICGHSPTEKCLHKRSPTAKETPKREVKMTPRRLWGEGPSSPKPPTWSPNGPSNNDSYEPNSWDRQEFINKKNNDN